LEAKLARDDMIIETEIFKMDEEFLKSQMKLMGNQINTFNTELASVRNDINFESTQRKELSSMFESYMKNYVDDIEGRLKAHIGENRETIESLSRALRTSEQNLNTVVEDQRRQQTEIVGVIDKVRQELGGTLESEKSAKTAAIDSVMEELRVIRKYLDEDLKRTLTNQFDTYNMIESRVRDVSGAFDSHQKSFENHQKLIISNEQQRERQLEDRFMKMKGDFNQELLKVAGMSKDIDALRSMLEREAAERVKEMGMTVEALRAEDAKVQKAIMDNGSDIKREAGQMMQDLKRALDAESGERNKALDRLVKQLDDQKRDLTGQHQTMSDKLRQMVGEETNRLGQQIKDVTAKHDGLRGNLEANLQRTSQDVDGKLQRLLAEVTWRLCCRGLPKIPIRSCLQCKTATWH